MAGGRAWLRSAEYRGSRFALAVWRPGPVSAAAKGPSHPLCLFVLFSLVS